MKGNYQHGPVGTCDYCGKLCFTSRADAKLWIKKLPGSKLHVYSCHEYFHYGHQSTELDREDYRQINASMERKFGVHARHRDK